MSSDEVPCNCSVWPQECNVPFKPVMSWAYAYMIHTGQLGPGKCTLPSKLENIGIKASEDFYEPLPL